MTAPRNGVAKNNGKPSPTIIKSIVAFFITFVFMFASWIVLSGKFEPLSLWLGVISSLFVAYYFYDLLFPVIGGGYACIFFKFIQYIPWLILEIIKANFHVMKIVFHPEMRTLIDPQIITFRTNLKSDIAITTLANSITLTPGTITVTADSDGVFRVHAMDKASADALPGTMLKKVANVFGEEI